MWRFVLLLLSALPLVAEEGWFEFSPPPDPFRESAIDLRSLNQKFAGEQGRVAARGEEFIFSNSGEAVRFWAVNGPPRNLSPEALKTTARRLAKYGVNLTRLHSPIFDKAGAADPKKIAESQAIVAAMKAEGIYSLFSIYFPLWMTPKPDDAHLKGYDGKTHPFAALMFNPDFQRQYREWWKALLLTPDAAGKRLVDDPAVFALEVQNEDSFFFWTFDAKRLPDAQLRILEAQFGAWLKRRYGSLDAAFEKWDNLKLERDNPAEGRIAFRPLWNIFSEKKTRDIETAQFLAELQRNFYAETVAFLRSLGYKGLVTASNWATASPEVLGPIEKWTYTATDFIDRHGYFGVDHKGQDSAWSIRNGHTYNDRSALRFEPSSPGKPKQFAHPAMEICYDGKPSIISETTWNRPNRFRSEAPIYYAAYGALQGTDGVIHFAHDGDRWSVKPNFWMQPWTLMTPSQMAQFPAAALIYRRGLIRPGETLARVRINTNDLLTLKGTPLPQDANFDELRLKDIPAEDAALKPGQRIDPLIHYAGRAEVDFTARPSDVDLKPLAPYVDRAKQIVRSTTGELSLDYNKGLLTLNAPRVQGASGHLASSAIDLKDIMIESPLDNVHIVLVSLDDLPLATSKKMLLQVMSEEKPSNFATENAGKGLKRITNIGNDPWLVKNLAGKIKLKTPVKVQPLDQNGYPTGAAASANDINLGPGTIYYLIAR